jgi:SAM-dependent methyltransferase
MKFAHSIEVYNKDSATEILPYILNLLKPKSILDVGCGLATWLSVANKNSITDIFGLDSTINSELIELDSKFLSQVDISKGFNLNRKFDLIICLEVIEHIPEENSSVFIDSLIKHSDTILFSGAIPKQGGDGHINEKPIEFWFNMFSEKGFYAADIIRPRFWNNPHVKWWYKQNTFLYTKQPSEEQITHQIYIHPELFYDKITQLEKCRSEIHNITNGKYTITFYIKILIKKILKSLRYHEARN